MAAADAVYADVLAAAERAELASLTVWDRLARHVGDYDPAVLEEWGADGVTLVGGPACDVWSVGLCFTERGVRFVELQVALEQECPAREHIRVLGAVACGADALAAANAMRSIWALWAGGAIAAGPSESRARRAAVDRAHLAAPLLATLHDALETPPRDVPEWIHLVLLACGWGDVPDDLSTRLAGRL